jgi:hypothetical protein
MWVERRLWRLIRFRELNVKIKSCENSELEQSNFVIVRRLCHDDLSVRVMDGERFIVDAVHDGVRWKFMQVR